MVAAIVAGFLLKPSDKAALVAEASLREKEVEGKASNKTINLRGKAVNEEGIEGEPQIAESPRRINLRAKPSEEVDSEVNEREEE